MTDTPNQAADQTPPEPVTLDTGKRVGPAIADELGELRSLPFSFSDEGVIEFGPGVSAADRKRVAAVFAAHDPERPSRAEILAELDAIDWRKIRALSDAKLTNDLTRLRELERQQADLRKQLDA